MTTETSRMAGRLIGAVAQAVMVARILEQPFRISLSS